MTVNVYNPSVPLVAGQAYTFPLALLSQADVKIFKASPTMLDGDFILFRRVGGTWSRIGNTTNLPALIGISTKALILTLTADETTGAEAIAVLCSDASGAEWCDLLIVKDASSAVSVGISDLTQGQILSDATPFPGANIDAPISSSAPSAAAIADAVLDEALGDHTVSGTTGGALGKIGVAAITVRSPVGISGDVRTVQGATYADDYNNAIEWEDDDGVWPDLDAVGLTVECRISADLVFPVTVITPTGATKVIRMELDGTDTASVSAVPHRFRVWALYPMVDADPIEIPLVSGPWVSEAEPPE